MKIRKEFRVESAHIVRNCTSHRCSHSVHGHSAVIEVFLEASTLDNAQMVYDFGLMKGTVKEFVDSMDHCYLLCNKDSLEFRNFIKSNCDRWIELPFNPSAEMLSMFVFHYIQTILKNTITNNNEGDVRLAAVRYHETATGYAECNKEDVDKLYPADDQVVFSEGVIRDWGHDLTKVIFNGETVVNPEVKKQINL